MGEPIPKQFSIPRAMFVDGLRELCAKATGAAQRVTSNGGKGIHGKSDTSTLGIVFMAFLCAVLPLDISQLSLAIVGAVLYAVLHKSDQFVQKKPNISVIVEVAAPQKAAPRKDSPQKAAAFNAKSRGYSGAHTKPGPAVIVSPVVREHSVQPVLAPTFQSKGWEGETREFILQIMPTSEGDQKVKQLARLAQQTIKALVPEVEVNGFASANFATGSAFAVAVPEVDIVVRVTPQILSARLHGANGLGNAWQRDPKQLQKCAIRIFTDRLVSVGGFKFRRSSFRGQEPKVTLLAPASLGNFSEATPVDFSVNVMTPLYNAALLTDCGKIDTRAKELILIVRRWAKNRGICHAAKGHLSPYLWGLLTIYFLQVRKTDVEGPLLPPLEQFEMSASFSKKDGSATGTSEEPKWKPAEATELRTSAGSLFKEFVHFFNSSFDWRNEAVSIRTGRRASPSLELPLHIIVSDEKTMSQVGPSIEDPFHAAQNLGDGMNLMSLTRLKEELSRAEAMCDSDASLEQLLEPWAPADLETAEPKHCEHANGEEDPAPVVRKGKDVLKKFPGAKGKDWRQDAAEARAPAAASPHRSATVVSPRR